MNFKVILFLGITIFVTINSKGQEYPCTDGVLYDIIFKEMELYERKAVELEIGYKPNASTIELLNKHNILNFNAKELKILNQRHKSKNYDRCAKFKKQIQLILSDDVVKENGSYIKHYFSQVISLSDTKKSIFHTTSIASKKYEGGKAIGHNMIFVFSLIDDKWVLIDKKSIEMY